MKRKIILFLTLAGLIVCISGCGNSEQSSNSTITPTTTKIIEETTTDVTTTSAENFETTLDITEQETTESYEDYYNDYNSFDELDYGQETTDSAGLVYDDNGNAIVARRIDE